MSKLKQIDYRAINGIADYFISAYLVMLGLGGLANYLQMPKLAIGYIPTLVIMFIIRVATPYGLYNPKIYQIENMYKKMPKRRR